MSRILMLTAIKLLLIQCNQYLLLAECEVHVFPFLLWPAKREARGPCKQGRKKRGSINCRMDHANEANKMFIIWLC